MPDETPTKNTRVYLVTVGEKDHRLVRAGSAAQAERHVAKTLLSTRVATVDDAHRLQGVRIEEAGE